MDVSGFFECKSISLVVCFRSAEPHLESFEILTPRRGCGEGAWNFRKEAANDTTGVVVDVVALLSLCIFLSLILVVLGACPSIVAEEFHRTSHEGASSLAFFLRSDDRS